MANNIYIGNRYVPIFADPITWDNLRTYEPLTIVTYEGTSYTSKQYVPVGIALTNTEYWAVTGDYNYQVAQYKAEVDALEGTVETMNTNLTNQINTVNTTLGGRIDTTNSRIDTTNGNVTAVSNRVSSLEFEDNLGTIVCIGDSYLEGYTPNGTVAGWGDALATLRGKTVGTTLRKFYKGGAGFGHTVDGKDYNALVNDSYTAIGAGNAGSVGAVIFIGGENEPFALTLAQVNTAIANARSKYPNAKIYWGFGSCAKGHSNYSKMAVCEMYSTAGLGYKDCYYLGNLTNFFKINTGYYASDNVHLTQSGYSALATLINMAMAGQNIKYAKKSHNPADKFLEYIIDDMYVLELFESKNYEVSVSNYTSDGTQLVKSIPFTDSYLLNSTELFYTINTSGYIKAGNNLFYQCSFRLNLFPDRCDVYAFAINENHNNWVLDSVSTVHIEPFTYMIPLAMI